MADEKTEHKILEYEIHELANLLPMLTPEELQSLASDIKVNGQRFAIIRWRGKIIDGRNRLYACGIAKVAPKIVDKDDALPDEKAVMDFIMSANFERRHLNASERAIIGNEMRKLQEEMLKKIAVVPPETKPTEEAEQSGEVEETKESDESEEPEEKKLPRDKTKRVAKMAARAGTSPAYVHEAERIERESPEKYKEVKDGKKTISQARKEIKEESGEEISEEKAYEKATKMVDKFQEKLEGLGYRLVQTKIAKV